MTIVNFSQGWSVPSKHDIRRLLSKLRRQVRGLNRLRAQLRLVQASPLLAQLAQVRSPEFSQIEIGQSAQIDRTAQITAPTGTVVRLKDAVRLGQHTRLDACQQGRIALGSSVSLGQGAEIVAQAGSVEIGSSTSIGALCHLFSAARIKIGRNCRLGNRVTLYAQPQLPAPQNQSVLGPIVIEDHCWIGNNVLILAGVTIGQHSVIGDDAVIVSDVPAFSVAAGQPAKSFNGGLREVLQDDDPTDAGYAVRVGLKSCLERMDES